MSDSAMLENAIVIEWTFEAPVDTIWQMWTQPEHFKQWYGPVGFSVPVAEMDVRIGGKHLFCMERHTPNGSMKMWSTGEYREVIPNKRLVYTESMSDENGTIMLPSAMGMPDDYPVTTEVTITLEDLGGRTKMTMTHAGLPPQGQGANEGWAQAFDKLVNYINTVLKGK